MKEGTSKEKRWISFRVKPEEYQQILRLQQATTSRKMSGYARKVLLNKPVVVKYRNQTADDFLPALIGIKDELNAIGNNFNQVVRKLNSLSRFEEFRSWFLHYGSDQKNLLEKTEEIKDRLNQIYQWLQG